MASQEIRLGSEDHPNSARSRGLNHTLPWRRLLAEGLVIVLSILLAFGIDAWWDGRAQRQLSLDQQTQLSEQMQANATDLTRAVRGADRALTSLVQIIALTGPDPTMVPVDSLTGLFVTAFSLNAAELETSALETLLASAEFASSDEQHQELRRHLVAFRTQATLYDRDRELFVDTRERFIDFLIGLGASHAVTASTGIHAPTDFDFPMRTVLADPRTASWAGNLSVTTSRSLSFAQVLRARADSVLTAVTVR